MIGVDTGFFFALSEGHPLATKVFLESDLAVSVISRFELQRISFATGMPALDALILAGLIGAGCRTIYTRDEHFKRYVRKDVEIVLLD